MIREALAGRRIAVTGSTGFLGTAIVERLLRAVPDCSLVLLVRSGRRTSAAQRVQREILRNDAFDHLRELLGDRFDEEIARRVTVITGDVSTDGLGLDEAGRVALAACEIFIHSAATVSFDSAIDDAVEVNLLGPVRIVETLRDLGVTPHLVAVSTAYVAGNRRGDAPEQLVSEGPFDLGVDWRGEVAAARRARADADAESRDPARLARFRSEARGELGAAGTPALAAKTESLRQRWVSDQLIAAGRSRASSLGWPDAYAYTKALGEGALMEMKGDVPVSIVRPSIIESALVEPRPGWIRGFRMAEPVIISYARGLLREFPGVPEGTIDVIPVDLVVGAISRGRRARPRGSAQHRARRVRLDEPAPIPEPRGSGARLVQRSSLVRQLGPTDRRARLVLPGTGQGAGPAAASQAHARSGREGAVDAPGARPDRTDPRSTRRAAIRHRTCIELRRALRRVRRV